jgi:hypothetical protein
MEVFRFQGSISLEIMSPEDVRERIVEIIARQ